MIATGVGYLLFVRARLLYALSDPEVFAERKWKKFSLLLLCSWILLLILLIMLFNIWIFATVLPY